MALNVNSLEGNELAAGDYLRKSVPESRWGDTWDVFKSNIGKIVLINILILITFLPGVAIMFIRSAYIATLGSVYPFNSSILYPFYPDIQGLAEGVVLSADLLFYSLLIVAGFIASLGIAGGAYSIKKLINTHGEFTVKGFFHGIRVGYFNTVLPVTLFMLFMFATLIIGDWKDLVAVQGGNLAGAIAAHVCMIVVTVLVGIYTAWMLAVGVSYRVKFFQLVKNSFILILGTPVQTIFMAAFASIPVWLFVWLYPLGGFFSFLVGALFIFFGFSFMLIVWMSFTQWAFDLFITPNLKAEAEKIKAAKSPKELAVEKEEEDKRIARELLAAGRSELIARPIMPVAETPSVKALGHTFTRAQVAEAAEDRRKLSEEIAAYEDEHKNDPVYAEYNKMFAEREKALQEPAGKKGKKKRVSADNLLK